MRLSRALFLCCCHCLCRGPWRHALGLLRQDRPAGLGQTRPGLQGVFGGQGTVAHRHSRGEAEQGPPAHRVSLHGRSRWNSRTTAIPSRSTVKPGSYIVANGVRYDLQQFHFHHPAKRRSTASSPTWSSTWCTRARMESWRCWRRGSAKNAAIPTRRSRLCGSTCPPRPGHRQGDRHDQSRRPAACRSRLLDVHGLADHAALHRRRALVCVRAAGQHQPLAVAGVRGGVQAEFASAAGHAWAADRGE